MPRIMLNDHKASSHSFTAKNEPVPSVDVKPLASPPSSPPPKKASQNGRKRVKASASPSSAKKPKKDSVEDNGSWTLDKRAGFLEDVLVAGYKSADFDALATKYGLSKTQLINQLTPGRNNLRSKVIGLVKAGQA